MWLSYNSMCLTNVCQNRFGLKSNMSPFSHIKWILSLGLTVSPFHLYQNKLPLNIPKVNSKFPFRQFRSICTHSNPEIKELWRCVLQLSPFEVLCSDTSDNSITQVSRELSSLLFKEEVNTLAWQVNFKKGNPNKWNLRSKC